jgi:hypothetical protein
MTRRARASEHASVDLAAAVRELTATVREGFESLVASAGRSAAPATDRSAAWSDTDRSFARRALAARPTPRPLHIKTGEEREVLTRLRARRKRNETP